MRNILLALILVGAVRACAVPPLDAAQASLSARELPAAAQAQQSAPAPPSPNRLAPQSPRPNAAPASASTIASPPVIVLDAAHGGTNTGARGENGLVEKDLVLQIARTLQAQLLNHGFRVVMTRTDDSNPSYNDRAAIANEYRHAIFITLHVGSTGKVGTVRAFYDQFWSPVPRPPASPPAPGPHAQNSQAGVAPAKPSANTLISWHQAQRSYVDASRRLADLLQQQFAQMFPGSPAVSQSVALRDLRSVAEPAVAVEISSIAAPSADALLALAGPLSVAMERAVRAFRDTTQSGAP